MFDNELLQAGSGDYFAILCYFEEKSNFCFFKYEMGFGFKECDVLLHLGY